MTTIKKGPLKIHSRYIGLGGVEKVTRVECCFCRQVLWSELAVLVETPIDWDALVRGHASICPEAAQWT